MKARHLGKELEEAKASLQAEANDHEALSTAVGQVMSDLGMASTQEVSSLAVRAVGITGRGRELAREAFHFGVHRSYAIARSHYENINLATMSEGYTNAQLDGIEAAVAPLALTLAKDIEDEIIPREG